MTFNELASKPTKFTCTHGNETFELTTRVLRPVDELPSRLWEQESIAKEAAKVFFDSKQNKLAVKNWPNDGLWFKIALDGSSLGEFQVAVYTEPRFQVRSHRMEEKKVEVSDREDSKDSVVVGVTKRPATAVRKKSKATKRSKTKAR